MGRTIQVNGFPGYVTAPEAKALLEQKAGQGTVYAIKTRRAKKGGRSFAIVQFMRSEEATSIIFLAQQRRLWYGNSYLTARGVEHDIVPRPRTVSYKMENITLHFGCQTSQEKFSTLWRRENVSVNFGAGMKTFCFVLSYLQTEYKLELFYENIWQIELHKLGHVPKYLLIQLYGAPEMYRKDACSSTDVFGDPLYNYFMDGSDDQWVRTTDFTPSVSIGQSSALCLELPYGCQLPDLQENFVNYKEIDGPLTVDTGLSFSCSLDLVPIVGPPPAVSLPHKILFKLNQLVQNGCLAGPCLDASFYRMVDPKRVDIGLIEDALEKLYHLKECCYEPSRWLYEQYKKYLQSKRPRKPSSIALDAGLVYVYRIQITPCKVYFFGPEINVSNHVLRSYSGCIENFLRISFVDEDFDKIHSTDLAPRSSSGNGHKRTKIYERILSVLRNGIRIGNKNFQFLAFSSSQLCENSAWMFAPRDGFTASTIREDMGEFRHIKNIAKYAARLGQSFSSSTETLSVSREEIEIIRDIEVRTGGTCHTFSDGIGKISAEFARRVAKKCGFRNYTPSAFQIRYGGYKGVVAVDPTSSVKLSLRKSMSKYESENTKLNVLAHSKYQPCFLNRQLITLLSTLGVPDWVFEKKQREALEQLDAILRDPLKAQEALQLMSPGENTNILKEMLICGYRPDAEPFLSMMLQTFRVSKLFELRTKTRIFIPNGRSMMGCLDETRTLEYGQVFVQFSDTQYGTLWESATMSIGNGSNKSFVFKGKVVVAKNPCLHPGDVRVLHAVDVPDLRHMVDCIVFPQKGARPHPNECSGSDLDGDIYFVSWDSELIPPCQVAPMDYTPAPTEVLDHDVTIEEVEEYFVNYILNDSLGIIANAHTVFADQKPGKAMSQQCIELAKLFSIAVDFPKTGVPAVIPSHLYAKEYPDFMENLKKPTYESKNVIGKLFREVKDRAPGTASVKFTQEMARRFYDPDMEVDDFEDYVDDAFYYKTNYDYKLGNLMDYYGIKTEAEILSGGIMKMSKSFTKRRDSDAIAMAVRSLKKEARTWFNEKGSNSDTETDNEYAKASAWYHVTYHPSYWGCYNEGLNRDHYLSFAWCVYDKLTQIKKTAASRRRFLETFSLDQHFNRGLLIR